MKKKWEIFHVFHSLTHQNLSNFVKLRYSSVIFSQVCTQFYPFLFYSSILNDSRRLKFVIEYMAKVAKSRIVFALTLIQLICGCNAFLHLARESGACVGLSSHCSIPLRNHNRPSLVRVNLENDSEAECSPEFLSNPIHFSRRSLLSSSFNVVSTAAVLTNALPSRAEPLVNPVTVDPSLTEEKGLLESRLTENLMSPPTYGMESADVYYPS